MSVKRIEYLSPLSECNPENDNIDVHVVLEDGSEYTFVLATPNNVFWCMENEKLDYFFGEPMIFVSRLTEQNIQRAISAIASPGNERWLQIYG